MEDEFVWMENLHDKRVLKFIDEENKRTREFLGKLPSKIFEDIKRYYYLPTLRMAKITERGYFLLLSEADRQVIKFNEKVIVDSKKLGEDVLLQGFNVNKDGTRLAYSFSIGGSDEGITRIIDVDSGEIIEELKPSVWDIVWLDKDKYYYAKFFRKERTPDGIEPPAERLFLREKGRDEMIFGKGLPQSYFIHLRKSLDGKYALITVSYGWTKSDVYFGPLEKPEEWKKVYGGEFITYPIDYVNGRLYIVSYDKDGMGRVIALKDGKVEEIISEQSFPLEWAVVVNDKLLVSYLIDASSKLRIFNLKGEPLDEINFDLPGSLSVLDAKKDEILLKYESFTIPYRLYSFKEKLELIDSIEIKGDYAISEDWATSRDGTKIHMFKVKKRGIKSDKVLVFGYGGFGIALTPRFFPHVIPFIEKGGTFVMTNLRGGSEYGEKWHHAGMRENKQNVFDDYIACLEKLKSEGYKVTAWGRSNGGLLVSATLTQRPEIMDSALIGYPVIDMLRFHKLYIGKAWIPEYGDPDDPKDRKFLLRYSPYHNIDKNKRYPPTLIYTGLYDDRVHPAHALKFAAKLREIGAPVYLRVETKSGHMGASPETRIRELADLLAFVIKMLGVKV